MITAGKRPIPRAAALLVMALIAGCGGASSTPAPAATPAPGSAAPQPTATHPPTPPATPAPTPTPRRSPVGAVDQVLAITAQVDGTDAFDQEPIFAQSAVSTGPGGSLDFSIPAGIRSCTVSPASEIAVEPSSDVLLQLRSGSATCATTKTPSVVTLLAGGTVRLAMSDPIFVVTTSPDATVVDVVQGLVAVTTQAGPAPVLVGPAFETTVPAGADATAPVRFDRAALPAVAQEAVGRLLGSQAAPSFGPPDATGSPVLTDMFGRRSFVVGVQDKVADNPGALRFVNAFRVFEAEQWGLAADGTTLTYDEGIAALQAHKIAFFVAEAAPPPGAILLPFFNTGANGIGAVAMLTPSDDEIYAEAQRRLLRALVGNDDDTASYAALYRAAFDRDPDFAAVASLFGLP